MDGCSHYSKTDNIHRMSPLPTILRGFRVSCAYHLLLHHPLLKGHKDLGNRRGERELAGLDNIIIDTGGGVIERPEIQDVPALKMFAVFYIFLIKDQGLTPGPCPLDIYLFAMTLHVMPRQDRDALL